MAPAQTLPTPRADAPPVPETARCVALVGRRALEVREFPTPRLGAGDLLVRVRLCGICGSDLHWWDGHWAPRYPTVMGHEFIGEVAAIGEEAARRRGLAPGDPVAVEMLLPCWECERCRDGHYNLCEEDDRSVDERRGRQYGCNMPADRPPTPLWGGYAQFLYAPREALVHRLPRDLPWERMVFTEPLAVACRAVARGGVRPGESVVVIGPGLVGLMLTIAAKAAGASPVVVTGTRDYRLDRALELGADATINVRTSEPEGELRRPSRRW
jgi:threonine dehydrogenase-like Zn-dependent dehydrogenase